MVDGVELVVLEAIESHSPFFILIIDEAVGNRERRIEPGAYIQARKPHPVVKILPVNHNNQVISPSQQNFRQSLTLQMPTGDDGSALVPSRSACTGSHGYHQKINVSHERQQRHADQFFNDDRRQFDTPFASSRSRPHRTQADTCHPSGPYLYQTHGAGVNPAPWAPGSRRRPTPATRALRCGLTSCVYNVYTTRRLRCLPPITTAHE